MNSPSPLVIQLSVTSDGNFPRCAEVRKKEGFSLFTQIHLFSPAIYAIFRRGWKYIVPLKPLSTQNLKETAGTEQKLSILCKNTSFLLNFHRYNCT